MIARELHLTQIGDIFVGNGAFPEGGAEGGSGLVECERMKSIFDSVRQRRVVEAKFRGGVVDSKLLHPRNRRHAETAHRVKHSNGLDGDQLAAAAPFKHSRVALVDEHAPVVFLGVVPHGLVVKGDAGKGVLVSFGSPVLHVFEDGKEEFHALAGQQAQVPNHAGDTASRKGATGKANEDDFVAVNVVGTNEGVAFAHVLFLMSRRVSMAAIQV